jgi:hypothetical protein
VGAGVVVGATSVVVATDVVTAVVATTSGFVTVSGGNGVSSAPTRSGTASAKLATASHAPATTARRNLGIAHTYHARRRRHGALAIGSGPAQLEIWADEAQLPTASRRL